jgi:hypothetical protein
MKICVYYKYTTCFGSYRPSSGVDSILFIYANILKAVAIGYFLYQPKLHVAIVVRYIQNMLKTTINYFKISKIYGSISQNMLKYNFC